MKIGGLKQKFWISYVILGGLQCESWESPMKTLEVSSENIGVSNEIFWGLDVKLGISNDNRGSPTKIWGPQWWVLGLQRKDWGFQWKDWGFQWKDWGFQWKDWGLQWKDWGLQWKDWGLQWKYGGL